MTPTPKLRWAQRKDPHVEFGIRLVLQQWYAYDIQYPMTKGEWRDVPVGVE